MEEEFHCDIVKTGADFTSAQREIAVLGVRSATHQQGSSALFRRLCVVTAVGYRDDYATSVA